MGAGARSLGEDPSQRSGAGRVARQGPLRWAIALRSGAPVGWPGANKTSPPNRDQDQDQDREPGERTRKKVNAWAGLEPGER